MTSSSGLKLCASCRICGRTPRSCHERPPGSDRRLDVPVTVAVAAGQPEVRFDSYLKLLLLGPGRAEARVSAEVQGYATLANSARRLAHRTAPIGQRGTCCASHCGSGEPVPSDTCPQIRTDLADLTYLKAALSSLRGPGPKKRLNRAAQASPDSKSTEGGAAAAAAARGPYTGVSSGSAKVNENMQLERGERANTALR